MKSHPSKISQATKIDESLKKVHQMLQNKENEGDKKNVEMRLGEMKKCYEQRKQENAK